MSDRAAPSDPRATFSILGPLEVSVAGEPLPLDAPQLRRFLALLLVAEGRRLSLAELAEGLWPRDSGAARRPPSDPVAALRSRSWRLRALLPEEVGPHGEVGGYALRVRHGDVDAERFEDLLEAAVPDRSGPEQIVEALGEALSLWRGQALAEFRDEPWARGTAVRLEELRLAALERLTDARLVLGHHLELVGVLEQLIIDNPFRERFWAQKMLALYRSGRQTEALRTYSSLRELLRDELGVDPSGELAELEAAILRQESALAWRERRPVRAPSVAGADGPRNLPAERTTFVGRVDEIADLVELLGASSRIVTLVGPGGIGKTRLAVQVGKAIGSGYPGGAFLVSLADCEPGAVASTFSAALGLRPRPETPLVDAIVQRLQLDPVLLIVDNCEHVVDVCAGLVDTLLSACAPLTVVATSREPLLIAGEQVFRLAPLPLPGADVAGAAEAGRFAAIQLFAQRGSLASHGFSLDEQNFHDVVSICRRLEGIPLALELCAARLSSLSLEQLEELLRTSIASAGGRSRGAEVRHSTLQATIDWSHDLLSDDKRVLFRRLSIFRGGFLVDAARAVTAGGDLGIAAIGTALDGLVQQSLVEVQASGASVRFRMLEPIRQYAAERLDDAGEGADVCRRHFEWCQELAQLAKGAGLRGRGAIERMALLDADIDNIRAAIQGAIDAGEVRAAADLLTTLRHYWVTRGLLEETERSALSLLECELPDQLTGLLIELLAKVCAHRATTESLHRFDEAAALLEGCGDATGAALARYEHAYYSLGLAAPAVRRELFERTVADAARLGDEIRVADTKRRFGWFLYEQGEPDAARRVTDEALSVYRRLGDDIGIGAAFFNIAEFERLGGNLDASRVAYEAARTAFETTRDVGNLGLLSVLMTKLAIAEHDYELAREHASSYVAVQRASGATRDQAIALELAGIVDELRGDDCAAETFVRRQVDVLTAAAGGSEWSDSEVSAHGRCQLARIAARRGQIGDAAKVAGSALSSLRSMGAERSVSDALGTCALIALRAGQPETAEKIVAAMAAWRREHRQPLLPLELTNWEHDSPFAVAAGDEQPWKKPSALSFDDAVELASQVLTTLADM